MNRIIDCVNNNIIKNMDNRVVKVLWFTLVPIAKVCFVLFIIWFYCCFLYCQLLEWAVSNPIACTIGTVVWIATPIIIAVCVLAYEKTIKCCDNCIYANHDNYTLNSVVCEYTIRKHNGWGRREVVDRKDCCSRFINAKEILRDEDERRRFEENES